MVRNDQEKGRNKKARDLALEKNCLFYVFHTYTYPLLHIGVFSCAVWFQRLLRIFSVIMESAEEEHIFILSVQ